MCVLYCGRLVVPTVFTKAETRVPQQDLESLVLKSNGRIVLHDDASLIKEIRRTGTTRQETDVIENR